MGNGMKRAFAAAMATRLNAGDLAFLRELDRWQGVASVRDLGPQNSQDQNRARQKCKRMGLVTFDKYYWRMTDDGRAIIALALKEDNAQ
jgi:hypothetical protein